MAKQYRALVDFTCPADPDSLKKNKEALKLEDGPQKAALKDEVKWMRVKKGEKLTPYNDDILKSWLLNEVAEEVKANG